jgi:hypothetical protein
MVLTSPSGKVSDTWSALMKVSLPLDPVTTIPELRRIWWTRHRSSAVGAVQKIVPPE